MQPGQNPTIEHGRGFGELGRSEAVELGVGVEEVKGVVPGQKRPARELPHPRVREALLFGAHEPGIDEVEAKGIGAVALHELVRGREVALGLRHLRAVFRQHKAIDDDVAEGRLIKQRYPEHGQGVEPAPGLIKPLGDEFRREALLEEFGIFEGIMQLSVGHGAGLKPAVEHLRYPAIDPGLAVLGEGELVDELPVQIVHERSRERGELLPGADAVHRARFIVHPKGQGRAPNPIPRNGPIPGPLQPLAEAPFLNVVGHPAHLAVRRQELVLELLHLHVPAGHGAVDQGRFRAVAEGVAVDDNVLLVERAGLLQVPDDLPIRVLHVLPGKVRDLRIEAPIEPHGHGEGI